MTHIRKRIRKLSTAVFRGSRSEYSFDVFPITTAVTDNPVIFIFSKRRIDKHGRAHHTVSCVGETQSIVSEIKRHKRARCIKGNEANVVCVLKEGDWKSRTGVLDDIVAARAFSCVQGKFKPTIKAKLNVIKTAKILPFKQTAKTPARAGAGTFDASTGSVKGNSSVDDGVKKKGRGARRTNEPVKTIKKRNSPAGGKRIQGDVDSDGGQHRLSKSKRTVARSAKARIAQHTGSSRKFAA